VENKSCFDPVAAKSDSLFGGRCCCPHCARGARPANHVGVGLEHTGNIIFIDWASAKVRLSPSFEFRGSYQTFGLRAGLAAVDYHVALESDAIDPDRTKRKLLKAHFTPPGDTSNAGRSKPSNELAGFRNLGSGPM